jgi:prophage regulatory protein
MGVAEIAKLLGVSRQRVDQLVRLGAGFPEPVAELEAGRIWLAEDIDKWARAAGRVK